MAERSNPTKHHRQFTWQEWLEECHRAKSEGDSSYAGSANKKFTGVSSWAEAYRMASETGYVEDPPIVDDLMSKLETIIEETHSTTFEPVYDVAGAEVDMGRFLGGEPECMIESMPFKVMRTGRVVRIAVPICYAGVISQEDVIRRGAVVMALLDVFNRRQHPVEIWATIAVHGHARNGIEPRMSYSILVQEADQPLDKGRVMYALAHPSMLRVLGFSVESAEPDDIRKKFAIDQSKGKHGKAGYRIYAEDDLPEGYAENTIVLDQLDYADAARWRSDKFAIEWIEKQMKRIEDGGV